VKPRVKVWVIFGDHLKFGEGRARLLDAIDEAGSLKEAVAQFGMSYRNAWGYLRELEAAAGFKFLERAPGRRPGGGMRLTSRGRQFVAQFWEFHGAVEAASRRRFPRAFRAGPGAARDPGAARPAAQARRTR
jgi:molybdate transport system regulatory protein